MNKQNNNILFWLTMIILIFVTTGVTALAVYALCLVFGITFNLGLVFISCLCYGFMANLLYLFTNSEANKLEETMKNNREVFKDLKDDDEEDQ